MKNYVITIMDNEQSVKVADRCIESGKKFGLSIEKFKAFTPDDNPEKLLLNYGISPNGFKEKYSRFERCMAAFLSHFSLWKKCLEENEPYIIFEHDAIIVNNIPTVFRNIAVSLGKPSYGKYQNPNFLGEGPLTSKKYFPGAHAYYITPGAALCFINKAREKAGPTDVFLHTDNFPFLSEYYPWPVEAKDTFTTIQNENGCLAKHNYGAKYEII